MHGFCFRRLIDAGVTAVVTTVTAAFTDRSSQLLQPNGLQDALESRGISHRIKQRRSKRVHGEDGRMVTRGTLEIRERVSGVTERDLHDRKRGFCIAVESRGEL